MKQRPLAVLAVAAAMALAGAWLGTGCSNVDQLTGPDLQAFNTLEVMYGNPGPSFDPCDDALPQVDGLATDLEWEEAPPLFLTMNGTDGNGGATFSLEVRAIWTDDGRFEGGEDRIFFLIRYPDDDLNDTADLLGYVRPKGPTQVCPSPDDFPGYCPSPPPVFDTVTRTCDSGLRDPGNWTRLNPNGKEDQILMVLGTVDPASQDAGLRAVGRTLLGSIGFEAVAGTPMPWQGASGLDAWMWRSTRTNRHRVPQYAEWGLRVNPVTGIPGPVFSTFANESGFAEDLWVTPSGSLAEDGARSDLKPYVRNFIGNGAVPIRLNQCPERGREPDPDQDLGDFNGGLPSNLALWWETGTRFQVCDTLACSRIGRPFKFGTRLNRGEFDKVQGWGLQVPTGSRRDVRARATYEVKQEKGFGVRTLEVMRSLDTGNPDDVVIRPLGEDGQPVAPGVHRMVIGVLDNSGRIGSGSREILLKFQAPRPRLGLIDRCQ